jgi:hypothetical protein
VQNHQQRISTGEIRRERRTPSLWPLLPPVQNPEHPVPAGPEPFEWRWLDTAFILIFFFALFAFFAVNMSPLDA